MSVLWKKEIPLDQIDQRDGFIYDESGNVPEALLSYKVKSAYMICEQYKEWVEQPHKPDHGKEVTTTELRVHMEMEYKVLVNYNIRARFGVTVYYDSGTALDRYATPNGMDFIFKQENPSKTMICRTSNVTHYSSIVKGNLKTEIQVNGWGSELKPILMDTERTEETEGMLYDEKAADDLLAAMSDEMPAISGGINPYLRFPTVVFKGSYGTFCRAYQEFIRHNMTVGEAEALRNHFFGVCAKNVVFYDVHGIPVYSIT